MSIVKSIKEWIVSIIIALIIFAIFNFTFFHYQVVGTSMDPTLTDGQKGYALRTTVVKEIKRFDIVAINNNERLLVKRVVGLPNEVVTYKDNKLYINGEYVEETYLNKQEVITEDFSVTLGQDEYYCLGDNRLQSKDSREYGPFNKEEIMAVFFK